MRCADEVLTLADDTAFEPHNGRIWVNARKWLLSNVGKRAGEGYGAIRHSRT